MSASIRDYDMALEELEEKYGPLTLKDADWVDRTGRVRRINHTRANADLMDEMEAGLLNYSPEDNKLTLVELMKKYGPLCLTEQQHYVDTYGNIRRILPCTPLVR